MKAWLLLAVLLGNQNLSVASPEDVSTPKQVLSPNIVAKANRPMMMLVASKDHLLFGPIYTDFEDLDNDGTIDTNFKPDFRYYGYFDSTKCYSYNSAEGRFDPSAIAQKTVIPVGAATSTKYSCPSTASYWSGNFLNWVTMTRLDIVRKMLYGGYREKDSNGLTVLMGSRLVRDAHSFVKYYKGSDIRDYTPFSQSDLIKTHEFTPNRNVYAGLSICVTGTRDEASNTAAQRSEPIMRLVKGNVRFWSTIEWDACLWADAPDNYNLGTFGPKLARFYFSEATGNGGVRHEIGIPLRVRDGATYSGIGPDLKVRVKVCDPALLGEERCQAFPPDSTTNFKPYGLLQEFGYPQTSGGAARAEFGLITGSYDNYHENYLSDDRQVVGAAGALRKNMGDLEDEINRTTGVFCHSASSGCAATLPDGRTTGVGAIKAFDSMLLYSRAYHNFSSDAAWLNPVGEMLVQALQYYAHTGPSTNPARPNDSSVGMPLPAWNDPFVDSAARRDKYGNAVCRPLNILAISSSTISFDENANTPFATLPNSAAGLDTFVNKIGDAEGITGTSRSIGAVPGNNDRSCSAKQVNRLSDARGICPEAPAMRGSYHVAGAALYGNTRPIRTTIPRPTDLAEVENALRVRTMAASLTGGAPRIDVPVPARLSVSGNPGAPLSPAIPGRYVSITPESVQEGGGPNAPLTFVSISSSPRHGAFIVTWNDAFLALDYDMDITGFIRYDLISNPDSPSGWDIRVRTDIPNVCGGQSGTHGFSIVGVQKRDGSHASANGRYLTHQHGNAGRWSGLLSNMPPISQYRCGDSAYRNKTLVDNTGTTVTYADTVCFVTGNGNSGDPEYNARPGRNGHPYCTVQDRDFLHDETFHMVGETDALIKDPLWYAGKYGSFKSSVQNSDGTYETEARDMPSAQLDWDNVKADGTAGSDGIPDGYFLARRPELLETQLRRALDVVVKNSSNVPAVTPVQLKSGGYKYVAKFDSATMVGELDAYKIDAEGEFSDRAEWEAGALLKVLANKDSGNSRAIITNNGNGPAAGVPFRWASLPPGYKTQMQEGTNNTNKLTEANARLALAYIRGDQSREGPDGLRQRAETLLGPVVNGTPWIQGRPDPSIFSGTTADGYSNFSREYKSRDKLLWVAANDGMLHAFNPLTGAEVFAYVPGALTNRLAEIPLQRDTARTKVDGGDFVRGRERKLIGTIWPYVDGNPFSADVQVESVWRTYVFGTLGRGGKGVFALDATNPADLIESNAATVFKWQFTSDDDRDLGYITGEVSIHSASKQASPVVKMNNGEYALLLGNGQHSASGHAALFVLYMKGPNGPNGDNWTGRYNKIEVDTESDNGLSPPRWEDIDGNGTADVAYAGDLKGNLWKFDLTSSNPTEWDVAFKAGSVKKPLYVATHTDNATRLPITTAPQLSYMKDGGFMVNFATGNAFQDGDFPRSGVVQRAYGIWDRPGLGAPAGRALPRGMDTLAPRSYTRNPDGVVTLTTTTDLNWRLHDGWYFNFPGTAEAVLSDPISTAGVLSFLTIRPRDTTVSECSLNHKAALYTVNPVSGKVDRPAQGSIMVLSTKTPIAAKDIDAQKVSVVSDMTPKPFLPPGSNLPAPCKPGQHAKRVITGGGKEEFLCFSGGGSQRLQWREIPGLRTDQ
ncbi:pilus assembly protein [Verminephrobacter aporrectodeae]|nr:PilC/PilY family type IV pilus protein [Verminephrobacter aporrectodeae]